MLVINCFEKLH